MSKNDDYNPFSNTYNPNGDSGSSQPFAGSSAPFYSSEPTDSGGNPYSAPTDSSPYGQPVGQHNSYGQPAVTPVPFQGQNQIAPTGPSGNPYAASGSAPAYQGPQSNPGYQYSGYGYNNGNMIQGNNSTAVASLVLGILGITMILPFIGPLLAVIMGYSAKKQIRASGQEGTSLATAGLVLGWIGLAFTAIVVLFFIVLISSSMSGY